MRHGSRVFLPVLLLSLTTFVGRAAAFELVLENGWVSAPLFDNRAEAFLDDGVVHLKGTLEGGASPVVFTLPPGLRPATTVYVLVDLCNFAPGRLVIQPTGSVQVQSSSDFSWAVCSTSLDGAKFAVSAGGFTSLALLSGWSNAPFSTSDAAVALIDGVVHFKGAVSGGSSSQLFTLPAGFRPETDVYVPIGLCNAVKGRLYIQPDGDVFVESTTSFADAQCFTSLDGASFAPSATGFTPLSLANGWTNAPFSTSDAAVSMVDGIVRFKGAIADASGFVPFMIPTATRPANYVSIPIDLCNGERGVLFVRPDGTVSVYPSGASSQCFTSLDGASFVPRQDVFVDLPLPNGWANGYFDTHTTGVRVLDGIVQLEGAVTGGTTSSLFTLPVRARPEARVYVPVDLCNATVGRLVVETTGSVVVEAASSIFSDAQCFTSLEGASFAPSANAFTALTLQNGWIAAPFQTSPPAAAIVNGFVHLKGAVASGSGDVVFTLPPAMRPAAFVYLPIGTCNAAKARLIVQPTGEVIVYPFDANAQCFTSFDGVKFALSATGFTPLTLQNGWTDTIYSTNSVAVSSQDDVAYLRGAMSNGTTPNAFVLPLSQRPGASAYVPIDLCNGDKGRLVVQPSGTVEIQSLSGFGSAQCFTSLEGASYVVPEPDEVTALICGVVFLAGVAHARRRRQRSV